jgi:hypothetical protein
VPPPTPRHIGRTAEAAAVPVAALRRQDAPVTPPAKAAKTPKTPTAAPEPVARARMAALSAQDVPAVERARIDLRVQRCKKLSGRDKVVACRRKACEQHWGLVMACPVKLMPVRG